jgi:hypothetical protein
MTAQWVQAALHMSQMWWGGFKGNERGCKDRAIDLHRSYLYDQTMRTRFSMHYPCLGTRQDTISWSTVSEIRGWSLDIFTSIHFTDGSSVKNQIKLKKNEVTSFSFMLCLCTETCHFSLQDHHLSRAPTGLFNPMLPCRVTQV